MTPTYHFYIDDSGSRSLDKQLNAQDGSKWFALGGIIVKEEEENEIREKYSKFCDLWNIENPLHSYDIRNKVNGFSWLNTLSQNEFKRFFDTLTEFLISLPVHATACVIDRKGYNDRYREKYGRQRWQLCKTAFTIIAERAAKFSHQNGRRLKIFYEQCDPKTDKALEGYYSTMKLEGMPFNPQTSLAYSPLTKDELARTLWDCKRKTKSSPLIQLADLFLFPICVSGYDQTYKPFVEMTRQKRTINCAVEPRDEPFLGIKYSCFENVK